LLFLEIFKRDEKHSKTLTFFFSEVFVVDFVSAPYAPGIPVIRISEELKPLVDEDVVNHKVSNSIGEDTETKRVSLPERGVCRGHQQ
jgi:hypothetical protein